MPTSSSSASVPSTASRFPGISENTSSSTTRSSGRLLIHSSLTRDFAQAHIYIYHSWDVVYHDKNPGGSTTDNLCFVEDWVGRIGELVCAQEVGHALGLDHPPTIEPSLLMTAQSIADERLLAGEIEIANPL